MNLKSKSPHISKNDINFLLELGDSDIAEIMRYEMSEMYGISTEEINEQLRGSKNE